jgi:hypothetical protein
MNNFSTRLLTEGASSWSWAPAPADLVAEPQYYRGDTRGGPTQAEVKVTASIETLKRAFNDWLLRGVEIRNPNGALVFWGFVAEMRLVQRARSRKLAVDTIVNRAATAWNSVAADGSTQTETTAWTDDAESQARYGVREEVATLEGDGTLAAAEALRKQTLAGAPEQSLSYERAEGEYLMLIAAGWMESLDWIFYEHLHGRIEEEGDNAGDDQLIGWGLTSVTVGFGPDGSIHDLDCRLTALGAGNVIDVSGSYTNDGTYTIDQPATGDQVVYTAATIAFEANDDIRDSAAGLSDFKPGGIQTKVEGSTGNSRVHMVKTVASAWITTTESVSGNIVNEAAGPSITLTQGHRAKLTTDTDWEQPGEIVSVRVRGYRLAQSFVAPAGFLLDRIAVKLRRVGAPTDDVAVSVCADSAGAPAGSALATAYLDGENVKTRARWEWFTFSSPVALTASATYWIVVERSGFLDPDAYYAAELCDGDHGNLLAYTGGGAWVTHPASGQRLAFKAWATEDTGQQIRRIAAQCGQFLAAVDVPDTGISTNPYQERTRPVAVMSKLLDMGDSVGNALECRVTRERVLVVSEKPGQPAASAPRLTAEQPATGAARLTDEQRIVTSTGAERMPGLLPVGEWLIVDEEPGQEPTMMYVAECGYNVESGDYDLGPA